MGFFLTKFVVKFLSTVARNCVCLQEEVIDFVTG